jgi:hypothetical protein
MHIAIWIVAALLVGLWSLLAYGAGTLAGLAAGLSGLPADWYPLLDRIPGAAWMGDWLPGWREAVVAAAQVIGMALGWLGSALPVIVWVLWGLGAVTLVLCAAVVSGIVALAGRSAPATPGAQARR